MLISFEVGDEDVEFMLSRNEPSSQVLVSVQKENGEGDDGNGNLTFQGNTYSWWMNNYQGSGPPVSAEVAYSILNNPLSETIAISSKMIEFLACTQIAESHFTPGKLASSRVPGMAKLARAIIKRHVISGEPLASSFAVGEKPPFPMAATGGTGNGRDAVNSLRRDRGKVERRQYNTYAYDMSDDSDVGN